MLLSDLLGGGGTVVYEEVEILTSQSWTVPSNAKDNKFYVIAQGGGGSGANQAYGGVVAEGGDGGEIVAGWLTLTPASSETITIGAGGAGVSNTSSGISGLSGSSTTFGAHLTAEGGERGLANSGVWSLKTLEKGTPAGVYYEYNDSGHYVSNMLVPAKDLNIWTPNERIEVKAGRTVLYTKNATPATQDVGCGTAGGTGLKGSSDGVLVVNADSLQSGRVTPAGAGSGGNMTTGSTTARQMSNCAGGDGIVKIYYEAV